MPKITMPYFLLNPHGSDETRPTKEFKHIAEDFLTHTVQMKRSGKIT